MTDNFEDIVRDELAPDLEIRRLLGRGSVATVYLAREPGLKRLVAVKVLRPDVANADVTRRRFEREAQAAARLNHSSLTDIYRIGRLRIGIPYIVMEYIDGRNLSDTLKARGPMTVDEVRHVIRSVAEALAAAHAKGIIHRDVRPANVIREDTSGRVVLTDFGIAALLESGTESSTQLTTVGHRIGNPRYMSPEQLNGEALSVQSDIYSLGVLGYELLTGEGPHAGTGATAILAQAHGQPRRIADMRPDIDARLGGVLERCLARNPQHRPSASDVAMVLGQDDAALPPVPGPPESAMVLFLRELKQRKVYSSAVAYFIFAAGTLSLAESLKDSFPLIERYFTHVAYTLGAGLPITIVMAWVFDIKEGRLRRTGSIAGYETSESKGERRILIAGGFALTLLVAGLIAWFFLRS
jgi:serine/threonine protein kinase